MKKKESAAAQEMWKIREETGRNEERFRQLASTIWFLSTLSDKNNMVDAEMVQKKKEKAAMLRKWWIVAWTRWWNSR